MPGMADLYPFRVVELRLAISQHFELDYEERLERANSSSGVFFGKQSLVQIAEVFGIDTDGLSKHEVEDEIRVAVNESATGSNGLNKQTLMRVVLEAGIPVDGKTVRSEASLSKRQSNPTHDPQPVEFSLSRL